MTSQVAHPIESYHMMKGQPNRWKRYSFMHMSKLYMYSVIRVSFHNDEEWRTLKFCMSHPSNTTHHRTAPSDAVDPQFDVWTTDFDYLWWKDGIKTYHSEIYTVIPQSSSDSYPHLNYFKNQNQNKSNCNCHPERWFTIITCNCDHSLHTYLQNIVDPPYDIIHSRVGIVRHKCHIEEYRNHRYSSL